MVNSPGYLKAPRGDQADSVAFFVFALGIWCFFCPLALLPAFGVRAARSPAELEGRLPRGPHLSGGGGAGGGGMQRRCQPRIQGHEADIQTFKEVMRRRTCEQLASLKGSVGKLPADAENCPNGSIGWLPADAEHCPRRQQRPRVPRSGVGWQRA